jgi:hypothetical protein
VNKKREKAMKIALFSISCREDACTTPFEISIPGLRTRRDPGSGRGKPGGGGWPKSPEGERVGRVQRLGSRKRRLHPRGVW